MQTIQHAQKLHAFSIRKDASDTQNAVPSPETPANPDPRRKRGGTIPSIQEFLDAIEQVN